MQNKINSKMINNRKSPIQDDYIEKYLAEKELMFFVKHFSLKKASEFPVFSEGFSLL